MPGTRGTRLKDRDLYEKLRDEGASKEKAARISNAAAKEGRSRVARRGAQAGDYDDWTVDRLRVRARELGVPAPSKLRKAELISALRER